MEEIKVGEYIRTNLGHIGKIIKEYTFKNGEVVYPEPQEWVLDNKYVLNEAGMYQMGEQIVKHSPNILDLIEEGDYVNREKVLKINCNLEYVDDDSETGVNEIDNGIELQTGWIYFENEIENIVTHEMFESMKYEV